MATKRFPHRPDFLDFRANPERDAYFLGFFYADGYNNQKRGLITVSLSAKDEHFLCDLFDKIYLVPKEPCRFSSKGNPMASMTICSRELSQRIADLGAPQAKTFLLKWPTFLAPELERHFIRGHFDGDGSCIQMDRSDHSRLCRAIHIPGTLDFLTGLQKAIKRYTGLDSGIIPLGNIHLLHLSGNRKTLMFLEWLYQDAIFYMPRKRDRYLHLKQDMQELDEERTYIQHDKKKDLWMGRLPKKYKRVGTGYCQTYEEALDKWKRAMNTIRETSFEEWLENKPPQRKRGPTRQHIKERGIAEGRYLRKTGK